MNTLIVVGILAVFVAIVYVVSRPQRTVNTEEMMERGKKFYEMGAKLNETPTTRQRPITKRRPATTPRAGTVYQEVIDKSRLADEDWGKGGDGGVDGGGSAN